MGKLIMYGLAALFAGAAAILLWFFLWVPNSNRPSETELVEWAMHNQESRTDVYTVWSDLIQPDSQERLTAQKQRLKDELVAIFQAGSGSLGQADGSKHRSTVSQQLNDVEKALEIPTPVRSGLQDIDRALHEMDLGNIAFNAPETMTLQQTSVVELLLSTSQSIDELKDQIEAAGRRIGAEIQISKRMEARLSGRNFEISSITPEIQAISDSSTTEWRWEVEPRRTGQHTLHLNLSVNLTVEGISTARTMSSYDAYIEVDVTWGQLFKEFLAKFWQWLTVVLLAPVAGVLLARSRWLAKRSAESKPNHADE